MFYYNSQKKTLVLHLQYFVLGLYYHFSSHMCSEFRRDMFLFLSHFPAITCVVVSLSSQTSFTPAIKRHFFGRAAAFDLFFLFLPPYLYLQHLLLPTSSSTSYYLTPFVFSYGGMTCVTGDHLLVLLWLQCVPDILGIGLSDWIKKPQGILSL